MSDQHAFIPGPAITSRCRHRLPDDSRYCHETADHPAHRGDEPAPVHRRCCRCTGVYDVHTGGTDTHCPDCLLTGMP